MREWNAIVCSFRVEAQAILNSADTKKSEKARKMQMSKGDHTGNCVFLGHGRSSEWLKLKDFIVETLGLTYEEYNREETAGYSRKERLLGMLARANIAFVIMTAEDVQNDGAVRARENVVHEIGLFQGRLGFERAMVMLEDGCSEFSNIDGLDQIRFPKDEIMARSEKVRRVLHREGFL